jgi:hypothetical protein
MTWLPYQDLETPPHGLSWEDLDRAAYLDDPGQGRLYEGFYAFRMLTLRLIPLLPLAPLFWFPGVHLVGVAIYRWVARNRSHLSTCRLPGLRADQETKSPAKPVVAESTFWSRLFAPVDIASLVCFRIAFGAIMFWEVWRYLSYGWVERYYITPQFHFTYYGFDWVKPWPGDGMYWHFYALGFLALCILFGFWYRLSAALFFLGFTYVFLLDQAQYLNHFYLISLISFLMIFLPAHRAFSIDALRGARSEVAPAWTLWLLRAQVGIPYVYGGLAKLNGDWLRGEPMRMWTASGTDFPLLGPWFTDERVVLLFAYGGLLIDLLIVPLLLWPRTRLIAFTMAVVFHVLNSELFSIGIFPWLMIAATLIFFPADWPRRVLGLRPPVESPGQYARAPRGAPLRSGQKATIALLGIYLALQLLTPFRHLLYPGNVNWTEEGHRLSWHMMLRDKDADVRFFATDPISNRTWEVNPREYLTRRQLGKMATRPDMILQFSHYLAGELRQEGFDQIEVRAKVMASLNGRKPQPLIDPTVNLAAQPRTLLPAAWIVPLKEPLVSSASRQERTGSASEEPW